VSGNTMEGTVERVTGKGKARWTATRIDSQTTVR